MSEGSNGAVRAMSDAVLAIARERSVDTVLQRIVHVARELVDARYAALGVPDGEGAFARFITSGMSDEPHKRHAEHAFAGAALADDRQAFARREIE